MTMQIGFDNDVVFFLHLGVSTSIFSPSSGSESFPFGEKHLQLEFFSFLIASGPHSRGFQFLGCDKGKDPAPNGASLAVFLVFATLFIPSIPLRLFVSSPSFSD